MKIAIVGAGPVGLTMSHLLSKIGISNSIYEGKPTLSTHPSAHFIHSRSMEIFSSLDLSSPIYSKMTPENDWRRFIYTSSITSDPYRIQDHFLSPSYKKNQLLTSYPPVHFSQHKLVSLLSSTLPSTSTLHLNKEIKLVVPGQREKDSLKTTPARLFTADNEIIEADYVIACDGSRGQTREQLGINLDSSESLQNFLNIHFSSKQLAEVCRKNPGMIYFIYNPKAVVVLVMHSVEDAEFVIQVPDFPPLTSANDYSIEKAVEVINSCFSTGENHSKLEDISIKSIKNWKMSVRSAEKLRVENVFLAGDAAHTMTPAGGFGLNTGIGDVHNLYWKFLFPEILDSYEEERKDKIQKVLNKSYANYMVVVKIAENFGLDIRMIKPIKSIMEFIPFGSFFFKNIVKTGQEVLFNDTNARTFLAKDTNLLNLIFPEDDLEFRYAQGFFIDEAGELASNKKVFFEGKEEDLRLLPGILTNRFKTPMFLKVVGNSPVQEVDFPTFDLNLNEEQSMIIRPDGHIYWKSI
jgi:2-polyprenyl-6-methoxyphenol hydroxylase-like FAD-dependent oxidoreductase